MLYDKVIINQTICIPSIIFLQNGILGAKIKRPLLLIGNVHGSISKSTNGLQTPIDIENKN